MSTLLVPVCESICKSLWCAIVCDCSCMCLCTYVCVNVHKLVLDVFTREIIVKTLRLGSHAPCIPPPSGPYAYIIHNGSWKV